VVVPGRNALLPDTVATAMVQGRARTPDRKLTNHLLCLSFSGADCDLKIVEHAAALFPASASGVSIIVSRQPGMGSDFRTRQLRNLRNESVAQFETVISATRSSDD